MRKIRVLKQILLIFLMTVILLFLNLNEVNGALQSNKNTHYKKYDSPTNWMNNFRKMETTGEAMGLNETLNEDLTPSSESNNIDVHMIRTTEYGAIAILSASGYGNSSKVMRSTTGNNTGLMVITDNNYSYEWTAGGLKEWVFPSISKRYYDSYGNDITSAKVGDALGNATTNNPGCANWHNATHSSWVKVTFNENYQYFVRSGYTSIFSYNNNGIKGGQPVNYCRGVVVCGTGL